MPLPKQGFNIQLGGGLDTKTDPFQVGMESMLDLQNIRFTKDKKYIKRNGNAELDSLTQPNASSLSVLNDGLVALGPNLEAYSANSNMWINKGQLSPLSVKTQNLMVEQYSFSICDSTVLPNGIAAVIGGDIDSFASIAVVDTSTGETLFPVTAIFPLGSSSHSCLLPRVFAIGNFFVFTYIDITGDLVYRTIDQTTLALGTQTTIASNLSVTLGEQFYDGFVGSNNRLYLAWNTSSTSIDVAYLDTSLTLSAISVISSVGAQIAITADSANVWVAFCNTSTEAAGTGLPVSTALAVHAFDLNLTSVLTSTMIATLVGITRISILSAAGLATIAFEQLTVFNGTIFISSLFYSTCNLSGTVTGPFTIRRGVMMASRLFLNPNGNINILSAYGAAGNSEDVAGVQVSLNPTYFLLDLNGAILGKLAQSNAQQYDAQFNTRYGITQVSVNNGVIQLPYMRADQVTSASNSTTQGDVLEILSYGISIANITQQQPIKTSEAASALVIPGMITNFYDGNSLSEMGFNVYPEFITSVYVPAAGSMSAQEYQYQITYEWTDNSGRIYKSAPSLPSVVTVTAGSGAVDLNIATLKLSGKQNVRIMIYRWSVAQQEFFLVNNYPGNTQSPINDPTVDFVTYRDGLSDADIDGATLLYTTGGVLENIAPPASIASTVVKNRVWLLDAEDRNLLWYSKVLVEGAPIEFTDTETVFVSPSTNSQMSGNDVMTTLGQMDDKLIIFAEKSIRYLVGNGPDATGANNDYGDPTLISSSIGCENQNSIAIQPNGLMFQSAIGIWLLGRDLSTNYIGAAVEKFNSSQVLAAVTVANETRCAFIQASGNILIYDYFFGRWSTDTGIPSIGATIYQGLQTMLNSSGQVYQETPGVYLDLTNPVLMRYTTPWIKFGNQLQNLQRVQHFMILGSYYSPTQLSIQMAYDFNPTIVQTTPITLNNFPVYNWRVFLDRQKCRSMQITIQEVYTGTPGAGFDFSGLDIVGAGKLTFPKIFSGNSVG